MTSDKEAAPLTVMAELVATERIPEEAVRV
jgi:hypothetical protein